jgi:hypothetical protein
VQFQEVHGVDGGVAYTLVLLSDGTMWVRYGLATSEWEQWSVPPVAPRRGPASNTEDGQDNYPDSTLATPPAVGVPLTARQMAEAHAGRALPDGYWESMHRQSQAKWQRVADVANATPPAAPTEAVVWVDGETLRALRLMAGRSPRIVEDHHTQVLVERHMLRCRVAPEVGHG